MSCSKLFPIINFERERGRLSIDEFTWDKIISFFKDEGRLSKDISRVLSTFKLVRLGGHV